jgi:hypothetical protein
MPPFYHLALKIDAGKMSLARMQLETLRVLPLGKGGMD